MLDYNEIMIKLLKKRKSSNPILSICIYGSRIQNTATDSSDLDVLLITSGTQDYRGRYIIDGIKVEYVENSFSHIMNEMELYEKRHNAYYHSLWNTCIVLFDSTNIVPYLKDYLNKIAIRSTSILEECDYQELAFYQKKYDTESNLKEYNYYLYLECCRQKYHKINGCTTIQPKNVYDLYKEDQKAQYYCEILPNKFFRSFFLDCIEQEYESDYEKEKRIARMLQYLNIRDLPLLKDLPNKQMNSMLLKQKLITSKHQLEKIEQAFQSNKPTLYSYSHLLESMGKIADYFQVPFFWPSHMDLPFIEEQLMYYASQLDFNLEEYEIPLFKKKYKI